MIGSKKIRTIGVLLTILRMFIKFDYCLLMGKTVHLIGLSNRVHLPCGLLAGCFFGVVS